MIISKINSQITLEYLQTKVENPYFERKGIGEKDTSATKIANELIGMLNADGGVLAFGVADGGAINDLNALAPKKLSNYRNLIHDFIEPFGNIELEEVEIDGKLIFLFHVEQDIERIYKRKDNENIYLRIDDKNKQLDRNPRIARALEDMDFVRQLNFINDDKILLRLSDKVRDKNAKYAFRKD